MTEEAAGAPTAEISGNKPIDPKNFATLPTVPEVDPTPEQQEAELKQWCAIAPTDELQILHRIAHDELASRNALAYPPPCNGTPVSGEAGVNVPPQPPVDNGVSVQVGVIDTAIQEPGAAPTRPVFDPEKC